MRILVTPRVFILAFVGACVIGLVAWIWWSGLSDDVVRWAGDRQYQVQDKLAGALRAVRAGEPGAFWALLGLCFAYGFFHAVGPGHGKLVMSGYAITSPVARIRLITISLLGALGQGATAIILVAVGFFFLGWTRSQMVGLADGGLQVFSAVAIGLIGVWLVWRGIRKWNANFAPGDQDSHSDHSTCGHVHGPDPAAAAQANSLGEAAGLVLSVAVRPCTGAIFVLIITFAMGISWVGVMGAIAMALGTALVTVAAALSASAARGGLSKGLQGPVGVRVMASVEIVVGSIVALLAFQVATQAL